MDSRPCKIRLAALRQNRRAQRGFPNSVPQRHQPPHLPDGDDTRGDSGLPWLKGFGEGELHTIAASHGEGKFMASEELAETLHKNGQIAFQYVDAEGNATMDSPANPNGSTQAIEGIISPDGLILGKMGHSERYDNGLMKNIPGNKRQNLFANAVAYFRKR